MIQVYQLSNVIDLATINDSKFLHIDGLVHQYHKLSIYLLIPTRIAGLLYLLEYYMLVLFVKTQFSIWIGDSKPAEIWTPISGTERGYPNHWATLYWLYRAEIENFHFENEPIEKFYIENDPIENKHIEF